MASTVVETTATESPLPKIHIPDEWVNAANSIVYGSVASAPPITLVCGAKNCGKSTFSRYLLNTFLLRYKRVAYLDTDVGQPEFTPPGCLSLTVIKEITPDLTIPCLKTPERSYFFGDISSKRDPSAYVNYIFSLYDYYVKEYCTKYLDSSPCGAELPLIINTPGWVKGIGYDTLVDMLKYMAPSHVVKIDVSTQSKNLPDGIFWQEDDDYAAVNLIQINSARMDSRNRSVQKEARLVRELRLTAYFRMCLPLDMSLTTMKELAHVVASHPPYQVPITSIKIKHLHVQVPDSEVFYSLNATIVGLAISTGQPDHLPICVGLGLVRGIDTFKNSLSILTPVPKSTLEKVDLILQGFIQVPTGLLQAQGCISPYMSANVLPTN